MQAFLLNVSENLVSTLILALLGYIAYTYLYWKNRKEILHFFGIRNNCPNLCIYVSSLNIKPGGTSGIEAINKGYIGPAITKLEYDGALLVQSGLKAKPLALLPKTLQDWLGQGNIELRTIDVPIKISPRSTTNTDPIFNENLVILGSSIYNSLSHYYLNEYFKKHSDIYPWYFYFAKNNAGQRIIGIHRKGFEDSPIDEGRDNRVEPAVVMRINDIDRNITVFICAGIGSSATFGSARYLAEHWRDLQRIYSNDEFGILLLFRDQDPDAESVGKPEVFDEGRLKRQGKRI